MIPTVLTVIRPKLQLYVTCFWRKISPKYWLRLWDQGWANCCTTCINCLHGTYGIHIFIVLIELTVMISFTEIIVLDMKNIFFITHITTSNQVMLAHLKVFGIMQFSWWCYTLHTQVVKGEVPTAQKANARPTQDHEYFPEWRKVSRGQVWGTAGGSVWNTSRSHILAFYIEA